MAQLILNIEYEINNGLVMSPFELYAIYLYGIGTKAADGSSVNYETLVLYIRSAQEELEKFLDILFATTEFSETLDYYREDSNSWGLIQTSYPVKEMISLEGFYGGTRQVEIPPEWMVVRKSDRDMYERTVNIIPNTVAEAGIYGYGVALPFLTSFVGSHIPEFWHISYRSGFDKLPMDLVNFVGKLASINVFNLLGDLILGAGIASQSISIDGLSQSIATTSSAENSGYSSRVKAYLSDIKTSMPRLKTYYTDIRFTA